MRQLQPRSIRTDTLCPYTTLFRSAAHGQRGNRRHRLQMGRYGQAERRGGQPAGPEPARRPRGEEKASRRSEEHTSELQSLMRISYAVICVNKKTQHNKQNTDSTRDLSTATDTQQTLIRHINA